MIQLFKKKILLIPEMQKIKTGIKNGSLLTPSGDRYERLSIYNYKNSIRWLSNYEEVIGRIYVEDVNIKWAENFSIYLMEKGLAKNTISSILMRLKACLRRLNKEGKSSFNGSGIRTAVELTTAVYSTLDEIDLLMDLNLNDTPGLKRVRDVYVIQCFTGLRFSDLKKLLSDIKLFIRQDGDKHYFEINTQKTSTVVVIPVARIVKEIMMDNNYDFGGTFSYQYYNLSIKEVAKHAGIDDEIIVSRTEGGFRVDKICSKFNLMSSHTARRSFATNAFLAGVPVLNIMQITGHSSQTSFHRYIRCSSMEAAMKIIDHPFFN